MQKRLEEFEYIRHGTMDVLAFLNHADSKVYIESNAAQIIKPRLSWRYSVTMQTNTRKPKHFIM